MDTINTFAERKEAFQKAYVAHNKRYNSIAALRVAVFVITIILIVVFANLREGLAIGLTLLVFPFAFGLIVNRHNRISSLRDLAKYSALINDHEILRLQHNFSSLDSGEDFKNKKHPYLNDLDIFGRNSIFQLISRAVTPSGRAVLAQWLSFPASKSEIICRQESVAELAPMIDWRQEFQASGMRQSDDSTDIDSLLSWINEPNRVLHNKKYRVLAVVLPVLTIASILLNIFADVSMYFTAGLLLVNGVVIKQFATYVENITEKTYDSIKALKSYGKMIKHIETADFKSEQLKELQQVFVRENRQASASIIQLQKILDYLQGRSNMFYLLFNFGLLFDLQLVLKAEKWKRDQKADITQWFDHIGKIEAINSLAGFAYANPSYAKPEIADNDYIFATQDMGHPLIPPQERIANTIDMREKGTINIITGSNMSGKSTFLRTVGVNIVLALAGSHVCASDLTVSKMQVFTSMRTEDNLEEHVSSFYAELKRIRMLLDLLEANELPVLFMLDEILKGTNSKDRHAGASALIKQVSTADAMGFVSTHDLELGQLSDQLSNLNNYSFNSIVEGDEIIFNYSLEKGICHSFNASKLMEKIGIDMS